MLEQVIQENFDQPTMEQVERLCKALHPYYPLCNFRSVFRDEPEKRALLEQAVKKGYQMLCDYLHDHRDMSEEEYDLVTDRAEELWFVGGED